MPAFSNEDFSQMLSSATAVAQLIPLLKKPRDTWNQWEVEDEEEAEGRLFETAFSLITSTSETSALWEVNNTSSPEGDHRLWEKMLELAREHSDLDIIFDNIAENYQREEIQLRNFIRRIFDKADELKYPNKAWK